MRYSIQQMKPRIKRFVAGSSLVGVLALGGAAVTADDVRDVAPDPVAVSEPVVQVWGARTRGVKGIFGVHTWVAVKPARAADYTVYEVIGWKLRWDDTAVSIRNRAPDGRWFGAEPELYAEKRGAGVDELIKRIDAAARSYPYAAEYSVWPGPNSNTFTAWISRKVPELELDLPSTAIGKDYLGGSVFGSAPSGRGYQLSLGGLLGVAASPVDGLEFNLLGLNFGASGWGLKLPLFGTIGPTRTFATAPAAATTGNP